MHQVTVPEGSWVAEPLDAQGRAEQYKEQGTFRARAAKAERRASGIGWALAGLAVGGNLILAAAVAILVYREKPPEKEVITVDNSTGYVGAAYGARDAPKTFGPRVAMGDIIKYTTARLGYDPLQDEEQWKVVRAMSNGEVFGEYDAARKRPDEPLKRLGVYGHVQVYNWTDDPHPTQSKDGVWTYLVRFKRREVRGIQVGPEENWQLSISFIWDLSKRMNTEDEHRNYEGFQCEAFKAWRVS